MASFRKIIVHWQIGAIFALALTLRLIGIDFGLPQEYIGDEYVQVAIALKMLEAHALIPNFPEIFYHQPLSAYISTLSIGAYLAWQLATGVFHDIAEMRIYYMIHSTDLLLAVRCVSAFLGSLAVFFVYFAGRDLFSRRVGLIAALFFTVDLLGVFINHSGRVWGYMTFLISLALYAAVRLYKNETTKNYVLAVAATLFAAANLLPGIFMIVPPLVAYLRRGNKKMFAALAAIGAGVVAILVLSPRGIGAFLFRIQSLSGSKVVEAVVGKHLEYEVIAPTFVHRIFDVPATLFNYAPVFMFLAFCGAYLLQHRDRRTFRFLASFPIVYYFFIGPFFTYGWVARSLVPFSPFLALFSAYAINVLIERYDLRRTATIIVITAALPSLLFSARFDQLLLRTDTRTEAIDWIYKNLPEHERIMSVSFTNDVINQDRAVLEEMKKVAPDKLNARQRSLLAGSDELYPRPAYFAWDARVLAVADLPAGYFKKAHFKYYLKNYWGWGSRGNILVEDFEKQFRSMKLVAELSPMAGAVPAKYEFLNIHNIVYPLIALTSVDHFGPMVEIYEVEFK